MKIDARVSRCKFQQEVERLGTQAEVLRKRGVIVQRIHYPAVDVIFIPKNNLVFHFPVSPPANTPLPPIPEGVVLPPNAKIKYMANSIIQGVGAKAFATRISLDDFDQRAPSVVFCDPFTWEELAYDQLHRGNHIGENNTPLSVILDKHPTTKKPFLCMRGVREYHEHPQHTGDDWMQYRKHIGLFSTLDTIWKTCVYHANPNLVFQPPQMPQIHWVPAGVK